MPNHVCMGATLQCTMSMGTPGKLVVAIPHMTLTSNMLAANIMDHLPFVNITPFPICQAPGNPLVMAATAAALGTPTPAACLPMTMSPWAPGSPTVMLDNQPALNLSSKTPCSCGGVVSIAVEGQATHQIP